jgi:hypothetical protein
VLGELLFEKNINSNADLQFDASNLSAGMYYLKLQTANETFIKKVCIK